MGGAGQLADEFFGAWTSGNFARARELLRDDLSFDGPFDRFSDADSYLASLQQLSVIVVGADKRKQFVDGDDVCLIYDLRTAPVPVARICEWYRISADRIASISAVFDARPFAPLFAHRRADR